MSAEASESGQPVDFLTQARAELARVNGRLAKANARLDEFEEELDAEKGKTMGKNNPKGKGVDNDTVAHLEAEIRNQETKIRELKAEQETLKAEARIEEERLRAEAMIDKERTIARVAMEQATTELTNAMKNNADKATLDCLKTEVKMCEKSYREFFGPSVPDSSKPLPLTLQERLAMKEMRIY